MELQVLRKENAFLSQKIATQVKRNLDSTLSSISTREFETENQHLSKELAIALSRLKMYERQISELSVLAKLPYDQSNAKKDDAHKTGGYFIDKIKDLEEENKMLKLENNKYSAENTFMKTNTISLTKYKSVADKAEELAIKTRDLSEKLSATEKNEAFYKEKLNHVEKSKKTHIAKTFRFAATENLLRKENEALKNQTKELLYKNQKGTSTLIFEAKVRIASFSLRFLRCRKRIKELEHN